MARLAWRSQQPLSFIMQAQDNRRKERPDKQNELIAEVMGEIASEAVELVNGLSR